MKNQTVIAEEKLVDVSGLAEALHEFADVRDWGQFHSPKNLVMALNGEVGELNEIFQWLPEDASRTVMENPVTALKVREELADVLLYLVRMASVLGVDLNEAARIKLLKNGQKYPVSKAHGTSKKYNEL